MSDFFCSEVCELNHKLNIKYFVFILGYHGFLVTLRNSGQSRRGTEFTYCFPFTKTFTLLVSIDEVFSVSGLKWIVLLTVSFPG